MVEALWEVALVPWAHSTLLFSQIPVMSGA